MRGRRRSDKTKKHRRYAEASRLLDEEVQGNDFRKPPPLPKSIATLLRQY
jgi:hypothetical protein